MPNARTTVEEKVGAWSRTFEAIREEITPQPMRALLAAMDTADPSVTVLQAYLSLARVVTANDRAAAMAAAMLVSTGFRPVPIDADPDTGD